MLRTPRVTTNAVRTGPLHHNAMKIQGLLENDLLTTVLIVALAEEMAVREAIELEQRLRGEDRMHVGPTIVNRLLPPRALERTFLALHSPAVKLEPGSLVRISAWVRVPKPITGSTDGALLYDSAGGEPLALRFVGTQKWKKFTLYRRVPASGTLHVTMALTGLGTVFFDDVRVEPLVRGGAPTTTTTAVRQLFAVVERYPDVKAAENVLALQAEISRLEDVIADRRELYNDQVFRYNTRIQQLPANLLAGPFGWVPQPFFAADEDERARPAVKLEAS